MKQNILKYFLSFIIVVAFFFLWRSVDRAIFVREASVWMAPILWTSLLFFTLSLAVFVIKERWIIPASLGLGLILNLLFAFSFFQFLFIIIAFLLLWMGEMKIRKDIDSRLKIDLRKSIRSGSAWIIFALSLMIAFQYYFETNDLATEKYVPRFEIGKSVSGTVLKPFSTFFPALKGIDNDAMTVDQFLLQVYASQNSNVGLFSNLENHPLVVSQMQNLDPSQKELVKSLTDEAEKNIALQEGHKQLSQLTGRSVKGDEKIADVFSEILNKKVNSYFMPNLGTPESSSLLSAIIAIVILITAISLGSFLMIFWIPIIRLIFFIFKKSGLVLVSLVPAEKEVIQ